MRVTVNRRHFVPFTPPKMNASQEQDLSKETVEHALASPENAQIEWALGDLLHQRLNREDWHRCILLQQLATANPNLKNWNELIARTRGALDCEEDLRMKASALLRPAHKSFDDSLDDFIAEMLAVLYLAEAGHKQIHFLQDHAAVTVDIQSKYQGVTHFTEAKNLREPRTLSFVAFRRWHHNQVAKPKEFCFQVEFFDLEDPLADLTSEQESAVVSLVDELPNRSRPSTFNFTLPGDRLIRVRVSEGPGVMVRHGSGPFLVAPVVEEAQRSLLVKLLEPARKALVQLYAAGVPDSSRRLLFVRWKLPEEIAPIGEADNIRAFVRGQTETYFRAFFRNFALVIMHTNEDPKDAPKANWN
jgi:hypothetical protein